MLISALSTPSALGLARAEMNCKAIFRTLDEKNDSVERVVAIPVTRVFGNLVKHETDFEGKFFSLSEENGDLFAQITTEPSTNAKGGNSEYSKGTVVRGAADRSGRFTATEVNGFTIHRLECIKN
jgi:hypothetical protein